MSADTDQAVVDAGEEAAATATALELVHPATGEVLDIKAATTTELAAGIESLADLFANLGDFRQAIINELAGRLDSANARKEQVGPYELETNPPTTEDYSASTLEAELRELVEAKVLDPVIIDRVMPFPPPYVPPKPQRRVDKREVNKLKKSTDQRVLTAVAKARTILTQRRTVKVTRRS